MADYKLKLKALLHDPIDKQYVMWKLQENHEEVAQRYFNHIFPNEKLEEKKIKTADQLASAISRIIGEKEIKIEWQEINYIDLFSLKTKEIGKPKDDNEVKTFFERLGTLTFKDENERAELCFLFLWRFLPEIFPWITTHPADSRAPNHSIYDHLVQTSAIVSCLPKPAFLLFTIGPVQEFIATARKTSDLWAGSYLLSYLTYKAIEIILEELGPDNVIYPNLLAQPLVDKWLYEKFENTSIENFKEEIYFKEYINNCFQEETLTIANFPNRFLAIVPFEKAEDIGNRCKEKVIKELDNLVNKMKEIEELKEIKDNVFEKIKDHLKDYFQIYYVYLPWCKEGYEDVQIVLDEYKNLVGENEIYEVIRLIKERTPHKANVGSAYSLLCELIERFLASRKMFRKYENIVGEQKDEKCHLCGNYDALLINWDRLDREIVREKERLCGVCFVKRLLPKIMKNILKLKEEIRFPSTAEMATVLYKLKMEGEKAEEIKKKFNEFRSRFEKIPRTESVPALKDNPLFDIGGEWLFKEIYRKEKLKREYGIEASEDDYKEILKIIKEENPPTYYAVLIMDGDEIGKWLKGEKMARIKELLHPKVVESLKEKEDIKNILCFRHPMSASIHQDFSRRLTNFALNKVRKKVEEVNYGKLIYAGGDDILAFLPVEKVFDCAYSLQKEFKEVLGEKASMSAGIGIIHWKYPLRLALSRVRESERKAKDRYGRDAFSVIYLARSGEERFFGSKWKIKDFFDDLACWFKNQKISKGFGYAFLEFIERVVGENGEEEEVKELIEIELIRVLRRKIKNGLKEEEKKEMEEKFLDIFKNRGNYNLGLRDFANMVIIVERVF